MGIVNVTPNSFSDGGLYDKTEGAIVRAAELAAAGADIVDIGGESTRPGSDPVEEGDELGRVLPVLEGLAGLQAAISIDTRKACVARAAARAGAKIFNDVSALTYDPDSLAAAADTGLSVILMHAKGEPKTMHLDPRYDDVVLEVYDYLEGRIAAAEAVGIERARIAADPGIGFGKTMDHTLALARQSQPAAWARGAASSSERRASASSAGWRAAKHRSRGSQVPSPSPLWLRRKVPRFCAFTTWRERVRRFPCGGDAWPEQAPNPLASWKKGVKPLIHQTELM